jgi:ABC-2 type transport system ATP-binding protein
MDNCLSIKNLTYKFPMGEEVFNNLNLELGAGQFYILLGRNGCGKSTLINLLLGFRTPSDGEISIMGLNPIEDALEIRKKMSFMSHSIEFDENSSIETLLRNTALLFKDYDHEREKQLLDIFELKPSSKVFQLSLGQKCRIQMIASISSMTPIILIDEITAVLDPMAREEFTRELLKEKERGRTILMATNIPEESKVDVDKVICIRNKKLVDYAA